MRPSRAHPALGLLLTGTTLTLGLSTISAQERESRDLRGFDAIEVSGVDLRVRQGDEFSVEVFGSGDFDALVTEVRGDTLEIHRRRGSGGFFGLFAPDFSADITLPRLVALSAAGGSDVTFEGRLSGDELSISSSGGSDIVIDVAVAALNVHSSGGSDIRLSGSAGIANLQVSGGSDVDGRDFAAGTVTVSSSGGSDAYFSVEDQLTGSLSGGSDIVYTGDPAVVNVNASGGSELTRR